MNTNCGANFSKIGPYLGELGPKNAQKWAISWMLHRHENISNFLTSQPQMLQRWNLPRLCTSMWPLIWHKNWGVTKRAWEGVIQKLPKISQKFRFLAEFFWNFYISQKTVTYVVSYLPLYHWSKFGTNPTSFGGVIVEKPPRSSQKLYFLLLWKHLKVYNLTTTNGIMMKPTTLMYLYETFYLTLNWGVTHRA